MHTTIPASDYREVPWKNGGGLSYEIAADALWRVAIAVIERDGPFSDWRGYDRTIVAIDGDPVELRIDDETIVLERYEPVEFDGASPAVAHLRGSAARDLNVMTAREAFAHDVEIVSGAQRFVLDEDEFAFVIAVDGAAIVDDARCEAGDSCEIDAGASFTVRADGHAAVVRIMQV
jgi:environmental stress-induced protein Ves